MSIIYFKMFSYTTIIKLINEYDSKVPEKSILPDYYIDLYNNDQQAKFLIDALVNKVLRDIHQVNGLNIDNVLNLKYDLSSQIKSLIISKVISKFELESCAQSIIPVQVINKAKIIHLSLNHSQTQFLICYNNNTVFVMNLAN